jgi:SAM-dependent methyltransferase
MDDLHELKEILKQVGPENTWRPVYTPDNRQLADGIGDPADGLPKNLQQISFKDKRIADLGCNFGYYTFIVKNAGAGHVTGIDIDERIIRGCEILKNMFQIEDVSFLAMDITTADGIGTFEMGMMLDFVGKSMIATGVFREYLNVLERFSEKEMILSIRPVLHIKKHLNSDFQGLKEKYPGDYIRKNYFFTIDYVIDRFSDRWDIEIISPKKRAESEEKETLYFIRKNSLEN